MGNSLSEQDKQDIKDLSMVNTQSGRFKLTLQNTGNIYNRAKNAKIYDLNTGKQLSSAKSTVDTIAVIRAKYKLLN